VSTAFVVVCGVLGAAVGGLLTMVIERVPAGAPVLRPGPACPHCAAPIRGWSVVPVVSWPLLLGRCGDCTEPIGAVHPVVELGTAAVFALLAWRVGPAPELAAYLYLAAVGVALTVIDLRVHRLPDALTLPAYPVGGGLLALASTVSGDGAALVRALVGMAVLFGGYYLLAVVAPAGLGFGDVKLAGLLGLALGWAGWASLIAGAFLGFLYGGLTSLALLATGRVTAKTPVPFGPFMLAGAFTALLLGDDTVTGLLTLS